MAHTPSNEEFLRVHMPHQRSVFAYILAVLPNFHEAEDVYQEVTIALWKNFERYDGSRPYLPWAFGIARRRVASHFRKKVRHEVCLPFDVIAAIALTIEEEEEGLARERAALRECLEKLAVKHREVIRERYEKGLSLKKLAELLDRSVEATNMLLCRIWQKLLECTNRQLAKENTA